MIPCKSDKMFQFSDIEFNIFYRSSKLNRLFCNYFEYFIQKK